MKIKPIIVVLFLSIFSFQAGTTLANNLPHFLFDYFNGTILRGIAIQVIGFGGTAFIYLYITGNLNSDYINIKYPSENDTLTIIAAPALIIIATGLIVLFTQNFGVTPTTHGAIRYIRENPSIFMASLIVGILSGIFEEILYRGTIQNTLSNAYNSLIIIITIPNILFASVHLPAYIPQGITTGTITALVIIFASGMIYSIIYERTENLFVPILAHILYNLIIFISNMPI